MLPKNINSNKISSNSIKSKGNLMIVVAVVVGVILLAVGLYKIFSPGAKVSQKFIDKYNEVIDSKTTLAEDLYSEGSMLEDVLQKNNVGDYSGAAKIVDASLVQNSAIVGKINLHQQRVAELRTMSSKIRDREVKDKALALISLLEEEDVHLTKGFEYQRQLLEMLALYYKELLAGKTPSTSVKNVEAIAAQLSTEGGILSELGGKVSTASDEFFKVAGLEIMDSETEPSTETTE